MKLLTVGVGILLAISASNVSFAATHKKAAVRLADNSTSQQQAVEGTDAQHAIVPGGDSVQTDEQDQSQGSSDQSDSTQSDSDSSSSESNSDQSDSD